MPATAPVSGDVSSATLKRTRHDLLSQIRSDWQFPFTLQDLVEGRHTCLYGGNGYGQFHGLDAPKEPERARTDDGYNAEEEEPDKAAEGPEHDNGDDWHREPLDWRERTYASSDPSSGDEDDANGAAAAMTPERARDAKRQRRKDRRRHRLREEMQWNAGLRFWEARRDAWCGARREAQPGIDASEGDSGYGSEEAKDAKDIVQPAPGAQPDAKPTPSDSYTQPTRPDINTQTQPRRPSATALRLMSHLNTQPAPSPPPSPQAQHPAPPTSSPAKPDPLLTEALLPIAPPLLPASDPTLATVSPKLYPTIYNKVVLQSLTPSVPLNLRVIVAALVDGWKRNGEWPPRDAPAAALRAPPAPARAADPQRTADKHSRRRSMLKRLKNAPLPNPLPKDHRSETLGPSAEDLSPSASRMDPHPQSHPQSQSQAQVQAQVRVQGHDQSQTQTQTQNQTLSHSPPGIHTNPPTNSQPQAQAQAQEQPQSPQSPQSPTSQSQGASQGPSGHKRNKLSLSTPKRFLARHSRSSSLAGSPSSPTHSPGDEQPGLQPDAPRSAKLALHTREEEDDREPASDEQVERPAGGARLGSGISRFGRAIWQGIGG